MKKSGFECGLGLPRICIVDIGCGAGAASAAFVEAILTLQKQENLSPSVEIFGLGIEPSIYGITLYNQLMQQISQNVSSANIIFKYQPVLYEGISKADKQIRQHLQKKLKEWEQPCLSNVWVMQPNLISSPTGFQAVKQEQYNELKQLGVDPDLLIMEDDEQFGQDEALLYKQIFESIPIDHMPVMTIGTKNLEKRIIEMASTKSIEECIQEIANSLSQVFAKIYPVDRVIEGHYQVCFENPVCSYWRDREQKQHCSNFYANLCTINNLQKDNDWNSVISLENLELAWAKVRNNLLTQESFFDNIEIRLFETNLNKNLNWIQQQLIAYNKEVAHTDESLSYKFPKNASTTRPRELSRMEEEILLAAILLKLGQPIRSELEGLSYAYRLEADFDGRKTEYLYKPWFNAYKDFIKAANAFST